MRRSAKAEYGCLALIALARHPPGNGPVRVREIATTFGIPERYLVQILLQLKAAGLVQSVRGSSGGYRLARDPRQNSLGEVLEVIDGPGEPPRDTAGSVGQALASVWEHLHVQERNFLDRISIAQLAENTAPLDWVI